MEHRWVKTSRRGHFEIDDWIVVYHKSSIQRVYLPREKGGSVLTSLKILHDRIILVVSDWVLRDRNPLTSLQYMSGNRSESPYSGLSVELPKSLWWAESVWASLSLPVSSGRSTTISGRWRSEVCLESTLVKFCTLCCSNMSETCPVEWPDGWGPEIGRLKISCGKVRHSMSTVSFINALC